MPLCPQITLTPVTVTTSGMTVTATDGIYTLDSNSPTITTLEDGVTTAQSTADGKNKVYYSATTPGATANQAGDIWWQYSGGIIIGQWTGAGGTSWTANTIGNAVIANLDAGKITTGYLSAARIAAGTITSSMIQAGAITADMITTGTMSAARISGGTITSSIIDTSGYITTSGVLTANTLSVGSTATVSGLTQANGGLSVGNLSEFNANVRMSAIGGITSTTGHYQLYREATSPYAVRAFTSSERYKNTIVPIADVPELDPAGLLTLPVRAFKFNAECDEADDPNTVPFAPGLIAEEVDAHYPMGAIYGDVDGQVVPDSWDANRILPGMLALIQQQHARIIDLETRLAALEGTR